MVYDLISNLYVSPEGLTLIITFLGSLIFLAKDLRLGLMVLFILLGMETIVVYAMIDLGYLFSTGEYHLVSLLITFVLLTISLMFSYKKTVVV